MASLSKDKSGRYSIQFMATNGKRKTLGLGIMKKEDADNFKLRLESLINAKRFGMAIDKVTLAWISELDGTKYDRLAAAGLVASRPQIQLGAFLEDYISGRVDAKPFTIANFDQARKRLISVFQSNTPVRDIKARDAAAFRDHLRKAKKGDKPRYATATINRTIRRARQFFSDAVARGYTEANPFAGVKGGKQTNASRKFFVDRETIAKLLDAAPSLEWRLILVLSRFGGLRCPSEHLALTWGDVNWEKNKFYVRSSKTEHHEGGEGRWVPLFPEVRKVFDEAFSLPSDDSPYVIKKSRDPGVNWRTQLLRIVHQAGLKPWPKLFHNLRASCETELAERFPIHLVCQWIGNSAKVAASHYLMERDKDFEKAAQENCAAIALQQGPFSDSNGTQAILDSIEERHDLQGFVELCDRLRITAKVISAPLRTRT